MKIACADLIIVVAAAAGWGCSNMSSALTTSSLSGGSSIETSTNDQKARVHQVAATSARAEKCAFNFDAAKLKASYLDYELRRGATADQVANIGKSYDLTKMAKSEELMAMPNYCSDRVTFLIKTALQRHLAGDFTPAPVDPNVLAATAATAATPAEKPFSDKDVWDAQNPRITHRQ